MKRMLFTAVALAALAASGSHAASSDGNGCARSRGVESCAPVGGWFPYSGGIFRWWPCDCCFPCCGAPNDYCRKPLPCVCWPTYSADYKYAVYKLAPPEPCCDCASARDLNEGE